MHQEPHRKRRDGYTDSAKDGEIGWKDITRRIAAEGDSSWAIQEERQSQSIDLKGQCQSANGRELGEPSAEKDRRQVVNVSGRRAAAEAATTTAAAEASNKYETSFQGQVQDCDGTPLRTSRYHFLCGDSLG